ncbi:unnamed protein product [Miscanthus lutarioriparius]|uniref:Uncharacterized protein n=1 Tax=Miscanthus lutarioriparius TaxID=422564 RepID=A0A811MQR7_9POAL|nr:unnamed protein product [Miscanthus lutarioriparius]
MGKQWTSVHGHRDDNMVVTAGRVDYGRGCGHKDDIEGREHRDDDVEATTSAGMMVGVQAQGQ